MSEQTSDKPKRTATPGRCKKHAPCGEQCVCGDEYWHVYHICREPSCYCHSERRYHTDKIRRKDWTG